MTYVPAADRYERLPYRRCGNSGLLLPAISLGLWHNFGDPAASAAGMRDETYQHAHCRKMVFTAFDLGITHFDLANNYGPLPGAAEERFGRILKELPRDELIISSKAGYRMWPGPYGEWGSRKYLLASLDQSLKRMDLPYVDIFYSHRPDPDTPLEETLGALDHAVKSGKALYVGLSSYSGAQVAAAMRICARDGLVKPIIHQPYYHALSRGAETDLLPEARSHGQGVIAFCPLAQGLLTNKYLAGVPTDSRIAVEHGNVDPAAIAKVQRLAVIAERRGQTIAQLALAFVLQHCTSALIGASRPEQIIENVQVTKRLDFSAEELAEIDRVLA